MTFQAWSHHHPHSRGCTLTLGRRLFRIRLRGAQRSGWRHPRLPRRRSGEIFKIWFWKTCGTLGTPKIVGSWMKGKIRLWPVTIHENISDQGFIWFPFGIVVVWGCSTVSNYPGRCFFREVWFIWSQKYIITFDAVDLTYGIRPSSESWLSSLFVDAVSLAVPRSTGSARKGTPAHWQRHSSHLFTNRP